MFVKSDLKDNIQELPSQHTQRHLEKDKHRATNQRANNDGAGGKGEALIYKSQSVATLICLIKIKIPKNVSLLEFNVDRKSYNI